MLSIIAQQRIEGGEFEDSDYPQRGGGTVSWSPPQPNWNPWVGANIDEGPLAVVSWHLESI